MGMPTGDLIPEFLKATGAAAIAASKWKGLGDGKAADGAAVEAMRQVFDSVPFDGRVAIGEGVTERLAVHLTILGRRCVACRVRHIRKAMRPGGASTAS